ncbi:unnamed protein product [Urochloa humidicola]
MCCPLSRLLVAKLLFPSGGPMAQDEFSAQQKRLAQGKQDRVAASQPPDRTHLARNRVLAGNACSAPARCRLLTARRARAPAPPRLGLVMTGTPPEDLQPQHQVFDQDSMAQEQANKENVSPSWLPKIGMKFRSLEDAWSFWVNVQYACV